MIGHGGMRIEEGYRSRAKHQLDVNGKINLNGLPGQCIVDMKIRAT